MYEENKSIVQRLYEEAWSKGRMSVIDEHVSPHCRLHDPVFPNLAPGAESLKRHIETCRGAFPDLKVTCDDVIAERNEVVIHWTAKGNHQGQFLGVAPTNRTATVSGTSIFRLDDRKIVESWSDWNLLTLMEQLGVKAAPRAEAARL